MAVAIETFPPVSAILFQTFSESRTHQAGARQLLECGRISDDMVDDRRSDFSRERPDRGVRASSHGQRQQLVA
jgi:hypothetical protein